MYLHDRHMTHSSLFCAQLGFFEPDLRSSPEPSRLDTDLGWIFFRRGGSHRIRWLHLWTGVRHWWKHPTSCLLLWDMWIETDIKQSQVTTNHNLSFAKINVHYHRRFIIIVVINLLFAKINVRYHRHSRRHHRLKWFRW